MPFTREVPQLSHADANTAREAFIADIRRELTIMGAASPGIEQILTDIYARLRVTPIISETDNEIVRVEVRFIGAGGTVLHAAPAARDIAEQARTNASIASFGADPNPLLVARLQAVGVPEHEARHLASRIRRDADGRVAFLSSAGVRHSINATDDELHRVIAEGVRTILDERQRDAIRSDTAVVNRHRSTLSSAF